MLDGNRTEQERSFLHAKALQMQNQYDEISEILARHPDISPDEERILNEWIEKAQVNRQIFEELTSNEHWARMIKRIEEIRAESKDKWPKLLNTIGAVESDQVVMGRARKGTLIRWVRYAAAVIVLMIGSATFYFLILKKNENKIVNQPTAAKGNNDVLPGKYKAKLTLADGSFIVLDSVMMGKLAQQGGTQVMNKDGKLVYTGQGGDGNKVLYNTLTTSRGQMYPVVLSDNSRIWLNSESSIKYPVAFAGHERRVEITGEAYFEIAHDASKPFIVSVNGAEIKVLGTKFNVNAYTDEGPIRTTLLEGSVQVKKGIQQTTIKPGQQAQIADKEIKKINDVDVDAEVAWRYGYFEFKGVDIHGLMRTMERWYDIQTVYEGNIQQKFLGDIPMNMNLSQVMDILKGQGIKYKIEGKKITVSPEKQ